MPLLVTGLAFVFALRRWILSVVEPSGAAGGWWVSGVAADRLVSYFNLLEFSTKDPPTPGCRINMEQYVERACRADEEERRAFFAHLGLDHLDRPSDLNSSISDRPGPSSSTSTSSGSSNSNSN